MAAFVLGGLYVRLRMQRKMGIEHARVVLGHHSPLVTEVYVERDTRLAMEAMARLG